MAMTLAEQAARRVELALKVGCEPRRWLASEAVTVELSDERGQLLGLPIERGHPRSEWGLDLISAPRAGR